MDKQKTLFDTQEIIECQRCGSRCGVDGPGSPDAKMLRHSNKPKGLCVNCAVHDWLRNTYPVNIQLAQYGPKGLDHPQIQELFTEIMRANFADAKPDEIDWCRIVENWDLPFPHKMKPSPMNPCSQEEIDAIKAGTHPGLGGGPTICGPRPARKSLTELNELEPGLGDELRKLFEPE